LKENKLSKKSELLTHYIQGPAVLMLPYFKFCLSIPNRIVVFFYGKNYDRRYTRSIQIII